MKKIVVICLMVGAVNNIFPDTLDDLAQSLENLNKATSSSNQLYYLLGLGTFEQVLKNYPNIDVNDIQVLIDYPYTAEKIPLLCFAIAQKDGRLSHHQIKLRNNDKDVILLFASQNFNSNLDMVKYFVTKGANINIIDEQGDTPLHIAVRHDDFDAIKYLVEQGANLDIANKRGGTPLQVAFTFPIKNYLQNVQNYFENLKKVTTTDLDQDGKPFAPKTIPDYDALDKLPNVIEKKRRLNLLQQTPQAPTKEKSKTDIVFKFE